MILKCKNGNVLKLQNAGTVPAFQRAVAAVQNRDTQAVEQARKEAESLKEVEIQRNYNRLHGLPDDYQIQANPQGTIEQGPKRLYANRLEKYLDETASGQEMIRMADTAKKAAGIGLGVLGGRWLWNGLRAAPLLTSGELIGGALVGGSGQKVGKAADDLFHTRNQILDFQKTMPFIGMIGGAKLGRNVLENNTIRGAVESGFQNFKFVPEGISSNAIDYIPIQDFTSTYHYDPRVKLLSRPISRAERLGIPKSERNNYIKSNPKAGATTNVNTYLINVSKQPWTSDGKNFIFKFGEPMESPSYPGEIKRPLSVHFTTDLPVKPHSGMDAWGLADDVIMIPYKSIVENNGFPSNIEPMDTWFTGNSTFKIPTEGVKILTANPKNYRSYKAQGLDVEYSPERRTAIQNEDHSLSRQIMNDWVRSVQESTGTRPTVDTYKIMEQETGLHSGVEPKKVLMTEYGTEYDPNYVEYYYAPPSHSNTWHAQSMHNTKKGIVDLNNASKFMMREMNPNHPSYRPDWADEWAITLERDLPALQKAVQSQKDFSNRVPAFEPVESKYNGQDANYKWLALWKKYNGDVDAINNDPQSFLLDDSIEIKPIDYRKYSDLRNKINRILSGEILYKKWGGIIKGQNSVKLPFDKWYQTVPKRI